MSEAKKVSIIIPVYNGEKYIDQCIKSIIEQTYEELEIIIINDGSKDTTASICKKYAVEDTRIVFIDKENGGVSSARNTGLDKATGDYVLFVDADDWIEKEYIEKLVKYIGDDEIVISNFTTDYDGDISKRNYVLINQNRLITNKDELIADFVERKIYTYTIWAKLIKREHIGEIRFTNHNFSEDAIFIRKILLKSNKINLCTDEGYHYRINSDSVTESKEKVREKIFCSLEMLQDTINMCRESDDSKKLAVDMQIELASYFRSCIKSAVLGECNKKERTKEKCKDPIKRIYSTALIGCSNLKETIYIKELYLVWKIVWIR